MVTQKNKNRIAKAEPSYLQALRLYWQNEREASLSLIADQLAEESSEQIHPYYRLWIDVLADEHEEGSLKVLQSHINRKIDYHHPNWIGYLALVGLIHYENGENEAAGILFRKLSRHTNNPYVAELALVLNQADQFESFSPLVKTMTHSTNDYFVLKRAAMMAAQNHQTSETRVMLQIIEERLGENPLEAELNFHQNFSARRYRTAWQSAKKLRDEFPLNGNYQFYFAYTSFLLDRTSLALEEFISLNRKSQENDPDILSLIGATLLAGNKKELTETVRKKSTYYLEKAKARLLAQGLPTAYPQELLLRLQNSDEIPSSGKHWVVKLSEKQCFDLYNKDPQKIEFLHRAMGPYVKAGDSCFLVVERHVADPKAVGVWRLAAIYKAASDPQWHPTHRWQTTLKLQIRLEMTVPIEIEGNRESNLPKRGPHRFGLHEIDNSALHWIEHSVNSYTLDDQSCKQVFDEIRFARSV